MAPRAVVMRTPSMLEAGKVARWMAQEGIRTEAISVVPVRGQWGVVVPWSMKATAEAAFRRALRNRTRRKKNPMSEREWWEWAKHDLEMKAPEQKAVRIEQLVRAYRWHKPPEQVRALLHSFIRHRPNAFRKPGSGIQHRAWREWGRRYHSPESQRKDPFAIMDDVIWKYRLPPRIAAWLEEKIDRIIPHERPSGRVLNRRHRRNPLLPESVKFKTVKDIINKYLHELGTRFHQHIPMKDMMDFMEVHGVVPLDEDGSPLTGVILTGRQGRATFPITYHGKPVRPSWTLTWYKFDTGRYEVVSYVA